jgi:hypothetical protein
MLLGTACHGGGAGVAEAIITGGIPPAIEDANTAETVYKATYQRVYTQNLKFYQRFPDDIAKVKAIVCMLKEAPDGGIQTPAGNMLRPRTLQMLGMSSALTPKPCLDTLCMCLSYNHRHVTSSQLSFQNAVVASKGSQRGNLCTESLTLCGGIVNVAYLS